MTNKTPVGLLDGLPVTLFEKQIVTNASEVIFTDIPADVMVVADYTQSVDGSYMAARTSADTGGSPVFDSGSSNYSGSGLRTFGGSTSVSTVNSGNGANEFRVGGYNGNAAGEAGHFTLTGLNLRERQCLKSCFAAQPFL